MRSVTSVIVPWLCRKAMCFSNSVRERMDTAYRKFAEKETWMRNTGCSTLDSQFRGGISRQRLFVRLV